MSAREGGGEADSNPRLRTAIAAAKAANMPADNIKRAIQRGTGELPGVSYEEVQYEGYGPGGAAILLDVMTDNRNRTTPEVRHLFAKHGGNLGEAGCVSWLFSRRGLILVPHSDDLDEDTLMEQALEAGAEDLQTDDDEYFRILTAAEDLHAVRDSLEESGITVDSVQLEMEPSSTTRVDGKPAQQLLRLIDAFDDHDDVQNVWSNFDIDDELIESLEA